MADAGWVVRWLEGPRKTPADLGIDQAEQNFPQADGAHDAGNYKSAVDLYASAIAKADSA